MIYNFTGVQHLKDGDVTIPVVAFTEEEDYQARYHHEMEYALTNKNFLGLTIIVFNNRGEIVLHDNWIRKVPDPIPDIIPEDEPEIIEEKPEENETEDTEDEEPEVEEPEVEEDPTE